MLQNLSAKQKHEDLSVSFLPQAHKCRAVSGETVADAARRAGIPFASPCRGKGYCGACPVRFVEGAPKPTRWDKLHLQFDDVLRGARLGCIARLERDSIVSALRQGPQLSLDGEHYPYRLTPPAQRAHVRVGAGDSFGELDDLVPSSAALGEVPRDLTLHILGDKIQRVELDFNNRAPLGVAIHSGTSTITGWLWDLQTGRELATGDASIISSGVESSSRGENIAAAARRLVQSLCAQANQRLEDIADVVIDEAAAQGVKVSRFVWARTPGTSDDHLTVCASAAAVASGALSYNPVLLVSLEPVPWALCLYEGSAWLASASEWKLDHSIFQPVDTARAIRRVRFSPRYEPRGSGRLSLSGALDCVVGLRQAGLIDRRGTLSVDSLRSQEIASKLLVRMAEEKGRGVFRVLDEEGATLTQRHVREVQRLKAVMESLHQQVVESAGLLPEQLEQVLLVGVEAASLSVSNACLLGMLPRTPAQAVPATASVGARLSLLSSEADADMLDVARACTHLVRQQPESGWAERLYLDPEPARDLDENSATLLDFHSRGSVGIGRRA